MPARDSCLESGHPGLPVRPGRPGRHHRFGAQLSKVPEDVLRGAYAVFTAWGWAKSEIVELVPGEKMVVRAYDYYEADIAEDGKTIRPSAYMIRGVSGAFMDLAYGNPYPDGLYTFRCEQVKGIECGDSYGEFVVTKA